MRCCVPNCTNDTKRTNKKHGITFYLFPKDPKMRIKWLKSLNMMNICPDESRVVCCEHFSLKDFDGCKGGKIKGAAVPLPFKDSNEDLNSSAVLKVCRICLVMDVKMYHIFGYKLDEMYQQITGLTISEDDNLPQKLCWECMHRLVSCHNFRNKATTSQGLMTAVLETEKHLTVRRVKSFSRSICGLSSSLKQKHYGPDYCDIHIDKESEHEETDANKAVMEKNDGLVAFIDDYHHFDNEYVIPSEINTMNDIFTSKVKNAIQSVGKNVIVQRLVKFDDVIKENVSTEESKESEEQTYEGTSMMEPEVHIDENVASFLEEYKCSESEDDEKLIELLKIQKQNKRTRSKAKVKVEKPMIIKKIKENNKNERKITIKNNNVLHEKAYSLLASHFNITKLTYDEQIEEIAKRKDTDTYKDLPYKCAMCYRGFLFKKTWEQHNLSHSKISGDFECPICKIRKPTKRAITKHVTKHAEIFSCKKCDFQTQFRTTARHHLLWHDGVVYKCRRCPSVFQYRNTYLSHLRLKHVADFVCELCGYAFLNERGVFLHKNSQHKTVDSSASLEGPYCEVCEVRFASESAYNTHLKVSSKHSTDDDPGRIRNEYRDKNSSSAKNLRKVAARKAAEEIVECEQCGAKVKGMKNYVFHFKREHPDKDRTQFPLENWSVMCEQCGKIFRTKAILLAHMWVHTGEKQFKCTLCDKSFSTPTSLVGHQAVHSEQRRVYNCEVCGKGFLFDGNRKKHMLIHTGVKPYKCDVCEKRFKTSTEKRLHYEHVHLKKPWPSRTRARGLRCKAEYYMPQQ